MLAGQLYYNSSQIANRFRSSPFSCFHSSIHAGSSLSSSSLLTLSTLPSFPLLQIGACRQNIAGELFTGQAKEGVFIYVLNIEFADGAVPGQQIRGLVHADHRRLSSEVVPNPGRDPSARHCGYLGQPSISGDAAIILPNR